MRFDASMESLLNVGRSESFADLNNTALGNKFTPGLKFNTISVTLFTLLMVFSFCLQLTMGLGQEEASYVIATALVAREAPTILQAKPLALVCIPLGNQQRKLTYFI